MPMMLEGWNDEKMDGFAAKVDGLEATMNGLASAWSHRYTEAV